MKKLCTVIFISAAVLHIKAYGALNEFNCNLLGPSIPMVIGNHSDPSDRFVTNIDLVLRTDSEKGLATVLKHTFHQLTTTRTLPKGSLCIGPSGNVIYCGLVAQNGFSDGATANVFNYTARITKFSIYDRRNGSATVTARSGPKYHGRFLGDENGGELLEIPKIIETIKDAIRQYDFEQSNSSPYSGECTVREVD